MLRNRFPHPYTLKAAEDWIALCNSAPQTEHFCIEYNGAVCGGIGFIPGTDIDQLSAEMGYFVGESFWGKGIATAAIAQFVQHLFETSSFVRLYAIVFASNPASMKALQKNGFALEQIRKKSVFKNGLLMDDYVWVKLLR